MTTAPKNIPKKKKKKDALNNVEEDDNTLVINSIVKNMTDEERLELAKLLSKEGFRLLLKLLDPDNHTSFARTYKALKIAKIMFYPQDAR